MNARCLPALALLILAARMLHAQMIENSVLRLEVSAQTGSIVGLRDKRNGTEYIADPAQARLFELLLPDAANYSRRVASWKQQPTSVESTGDRIDILFRQLQPDQEQYRFGSGLMHFDEPWLPIEVRVTLRLQGEHIDARMSIANHSRASITGVVFPYIGGLPGNAGAETAKIILPSAGQRVFNNTQGALAGQRTNRYPGLLAASWLQFELGSKGVGIELRSGLQAQDAYFALSPGPFRPGSAYRGRYEYPFIAWIHYPHIAGQGEWTSPPALLHVHDSDWHEMATEHREWFRSSGPLPPAGAWTHALGFASYRLKRDDNTAFAHKMLLNLIVDGGQGSIADYPAFAQHLRSLQELKSATAPYYAAAEFRHHDGLKNVTDDAGIVVAVFANLGTPKTGIVLANLSEQTGKARFELPAAAALVKPNVFPEGATALDGSASLSVTLAPHQVIILAIDARLTP